MHELSRKKLSIYAPVGEILICTWSLKIAVTSLEIISQTVALNDKMFVIKVVIVMT